MPGIARSLYAAGAMQWCVDMIARSLYVGRCYAVVRGHGSKELVCGPVVCRTARQTGHCAQGDGGSAVHDRPDTQPTH